MDFPCDYPVKVIGFSSDTFEADIVAVFEQHCGKITDAMIKKNPSKKGNYVSVTVTIQATGEAQLQTLFAELKAIDGIKMVL
ncbi:MAG: hypothetical protein COC19_08200 [SAR86 cluster bacterium]|uniref:Uncharacterized protein n=1 Tax=SAR86 cluster bacterium TaxID=2030880 RepID=A0A2A4MG18_9GAMM|nr:MAG: hypothetical protein COC19_08200 [SAR86 cluster bacterium]